MLRKKYIKTDGLSYAVLDRIPEMTRVICEQGKVLFSNEAIKKKFGSNDGETCFKIPGASSGCSECIAKKCIKTGKRYTMVSKVKGRTYSVSAVPVTYKGKAYALETYRDITQEKNLKDKLISNNSRMTKDLEIARSLQRSILRHNLPDIEGYRFNAEFLPCDALGGDMYDCFLARDGRVIMYIADVSGHGVMPAMLTVFLRQEMFAQCKAAGISPARALKLLQNSFIELNTDDSIYITVFIVALDPLTGEFVCSNAGHSVPPLIAGKEGVRELFIAGMPISKWDVKFEREEIKGVLAKDERLLLYTDGLDGIHTRQASNKNLKNILQNSTPGGRELLDEIKSRFTQTKADDVTMLLCERLF